jgi:hypothetical protein
MSREQKSHTSKDTDISMRGVEPGSVPQAGICCPHGCVYYSFSGFTSILNGLEPCDGFRTVVAASNAR